MRFIGDLDPQDLAIYLSLAFGDYRMRPRPDSAVPIVYTGINDAWLDACEKAMASSRTWPRGILDWATIEMNALELRYLQAIEAIGPPLEAWVGPRCAGLLRSGKKIELEGALNPDVYPADYLPLLTRLLKGRADATTTAKHRHRPGTT